MIKIYRFLIKYEKVSINKILQINEEILFILRTI